MRIESLSGGFLAERVSSELVDHTANSRSGLWSHEDKTLNPVSGSHFGVLNALRQSGQGRRFFRFSHGWNCVRLEGLLPFDTVGRDLLERVSAASSAREVSAKLSLSKSSRILYSFDESLKRFIPDLEI